MSWNVSNDKVEPPAGTSSTRVSRLYEESALLGIQHLCAVSRQDRDRERRRLDTDATMVHVFSFGPLPSGASRDDPAVELVAVVLE